MGIIIGIGEADSGVLAQELIEICVPTVEISNFGLWGEADKFIWRDGEHVELSPYLV